MVCGAGINDADYVVEQKYLVDGKRKTLWRCTIYRAWTKMLERCYNRAYQAKYPTYVGCSVAHEWLNFSAFRAWMVNQDHDGKHLDKDILLPGNKVYGPDTCVFVSAKLNTFMGDCGTSRGEWPIGVHFNGNKGKFVARCSNPFNENSDFLGYFTCPNTAHEAWREHKHELACKYADQQTDLRIASALRSRYNKKDNTLED